MTIKEAIEWSKQNGGKAVHRPASPYWIRFMPEFMYHLTYEELTANDWEPIG